jgi:hypothetical protein
MTAHERAIDVADGQVAVGAAFRDGVLREPDQEAEPRVA